LGVKDIKKCLSKFVGLTTTIAIQVIVAGSAPDADGKFNQIEQHADLPWTPTLHYTCQQHLFRIVSDVGAKSVYNPMKMPIWTQCDCRHSHVQLQ